MCLKTFRLRQRSFQRDTVRGVSGLSVRASAPSKVTCCVKSQDYPLAPGHLPKGTRCGDSQVFLLTRGHLLKRNATLSLRTIRSYQRTFQRDKVREVLGLSARASLPFSGTCCGDSQDSLFAQGHLSKGYGAGNLSIIRLRKRTFQGDMLRRVSGLSAPARSSFKRSWRGKS